jgi:hypothetical protein
LRAIKTTGKDCGRPNELELVRKKGFRSFLDVADPCRVHRANRDDSRILSFIAYFSSVPTRAIYVTIALVTMLIIPCPCALGLPTRSRPSSRDRSW